VTCVRLEVTEVRMAGTEQIEPELERSLAARLFNRTWELLDKETRTEDEDAEMLTTAFAARYHWLQVGDAQNSSISDWQVSRVAAVLGNADLAYSYGHRSLRTAASAELGAFYVAYGHEAVARAAGLIGNRDDQAQHLKLARDQLEQVTDSRDRELLAADLADLDQ
jgi:hypothetical protein